MISHRFFHVIFFVFLFLVIPGSPVFSDLTQKSKGVLSVYGEIPKFELTDQFGKPFSSDQLKGKIWISDFIFTRCQGQCPLMSGKMAVLQKQLRDSNVQLVSFSVDPDYDSPQILSEYAERFHANKSWVFLTGEKSKIWELASGGFMLGVQAANPEDLAQGAEPVMHSSRFVLVDQQGKIRGFFDSSDSDKMNELVKSVQTLTN